MRPRNITCLHSSHLAIVGILQSLQEHWIIWIYLHVYYTLYVTENEFSLKSMKSVHFTNNSLLAYDKSFNYLTSLTNVIR